MPNSFVRSGLRHLVDGDSQLGLFMVSGVLVDDALRGGLVDRADSVHVSLLCLFRIIGLQRFVETTDRGLKSGLRHAVAQILLFRNLDPFHSGLDVCQ